MDAWGTGRYEETAEELAPVAEVAVDSVAPEPGARLLDVACGTGNAAAVALARGARVTGLDSSERLVAVARERIPDGEFVVGDAADLPFADEAFDAAVSVFGVIFASPGERAASEIARVVRPGGRIAITSWPPRGVVFGAVGLMRQALARVRGTQNGPPAADWGDPDVVTRLLEPFGRVGVTEQELRHPPVAPEVLWDRWESYHPMWIGARQVLEPAGEWDALREGAIAALREGALEEGAVSPYLLATVERA
jgi:SAM-dependent methyltransferase